MSDDVDNGRAHLWAQPTEAWLRSLLGDFERCVRESERNPGDRYIADEVMIARRVIVDAFGFSHDDEALRICMRKRDELVDALTRIPQCQFCDAHLSASDAILRIKP